MEFSLNTIRSPKGEEYQLIRKLGSGAFGTVWLGDTSDGRKVAIKLISSTKTKSVEFNEELAMLKHLYEKIGCTRLVICYQDAWVAPDYYVLVTNFIPGEDMSKFIDKVTSEEIDPTAREMGNIFLNIAAGVKLLHDSGIAHRDLKPNNIQISPSLEPTILDLGLGCFFSLLISSVKGHGCRFGSVSGTSDFMAPEVILELVADFFAADIFSLGAIFYELATGDRYFEGENDNDIVENVLDNIHPEVVTGSSILDNLILQMTDPDYLNRPKINRVIEELQKVDWNLLDIINPEY